MIGDLLKLSVSFTHAVRGGQEEEEDHYVEGIQKGAKQTKNFHYENFYNQIHDFFCLPVNKIVFIVIYMCPASQFNKTFSFYSVYSRISAKLEAFLLQSC